MLGCLMDRFSRPIIPHSRIGMQDCLMDRFSRPIIPNSRIGMLGCLMDKFSRRTTQDGVFRTSRHLNNMDTLLFRCRVTSNLRPRHSKRLLNRATYLSSIYRAICRPRIRMLSRHSLTTKVNPILIHTTLHH